MEQISRNFAHQNESAESLMISPDSQNAIMDISRTIRLIRKTSCGILKSNTALHEYIMQKSIINSIKTVHLYAVSPYRNGWCTKVKDPASPKKDKRVLITGKTEEEIYIQLVEWYSKKDIENLTLNDLYEQWMEYRKNTLNNQNTVERDRQHYERYFADTAFFKQKVVLVRRPRLKEFCCSVIRGETVRHRGKNAHVDGTALTRKEWGNARVILNGMFSYALDNEYIATNPISGMKFDQGLFRIPIPKKKETEIYNTAEEKDLVAWCNRKFTETGDVAYLLPPLSFCIATRIGECVALKWTDWEDMRHMNISRQEYLDRATRQVSVVEHTKTHHSRRILLSKKAVGILNQIRLAGCGSEWIFARDGKRLTERQANYILEKYAKETGTPLKSSHKLRKTCGSNLYKNNGFTSRQCADYLGHSEQVFLNNYSFDTDTEEELIAKLDKVI